MRRTAAGAVRSGVIQSRPVPRPAVQKAVPPAAEKPPPGLAAQCEIAPGFIEVSLEAAILNGPLSCKNMGKGFDHQILCLVDIAQHAVDVKGQRVTIPLHQQLSGSFVSGQILPVGCFV